jgi:hypothetical protein
MFFLLSPGTEEFSGKKFAPQEKAAPKMGKYPSLYYNLKAFNSLYLTRKLIFITVLYYTIGVTISHNIDRATNRGFFPRIPLLKIENRHLAVAFISKKIHFFANAKRIS